MKQPKLYQFAKLTALFVVGAIPVLGATDANAKQTSSMLPPIVHRASGTQLPTADNSSARASHKPAAPSYTTIRPDSASSIVGEKSNPASNNLLAPIGSGIVKQVAGRVEPGIPRVARAFSPAKMPIRTQGSGSRSIPAPPVQIPSPVSGLQPRGLGSVTTPAPPVISGSLVGPGNEAPLFGGAPGEPTGNFFDSGPVVDSVPMQSVVSGCSDCGDGGGNCDSCGPNGCYNPNLINCDYGTYGSVSAARRYAYLEFLYLRREDGDITNSNFSTLGEFDFNAAWRVTLGQRSDMTQGREFSYFGTDDIDAEETVTDDQNRLNAFFVPAAGLVPADLTAFFGASEQSQFKRTNIQSFELNKVRWGWDVVKSFVGFRYLYMADRYELNSTASTFDFLGNPTGVESGRQRIDTFNNLFGGHIGAELFYDVGYRISVSGLSKFGVFANINRVENFIENDGTTILDVEDESATISTTYDIQLLAHYQLRQSTRLRVGYTGLFLGQVATTSDNFTPFVTPLAGFDTSDSDDAFIQGFTVGLEIYR